MFSSTFQGKFNFQGLFKTDLYIQVLFEPVGVQFYCVSSKGSVMTILMRRLFQAFAEHIAISNKKNSHIVAPMSTYASSIDSLQLYRLSNLVCKEKKVYVILVDIL